MIGYIYWGDSTIQWHSFSQDERRWVAPSAIFHLRENGNQVDVFWPKFDQAWQMIFHQRELHDHTIREAFLIISLRSVQSHIDSGCPHFKCDHRVLRHWANATFSSPLPSGTVCPLWQSAGEGPPFVGIICIQPFSNISSELRRATIMLKPHVSK